MKLIFNKLQRDVLRRHIGPFVFCFLTVMFLLLMQFLMLHIDKLVGKGLPLGIIIELIITNLAYMVVLAAPMATLVACLMAFGKFSELNELTAMRAAGVNPFHVIKPVLISAFFLCIFLGWFSNYVLPDANQRARSLFIDIRTKKPGFDLKPNEFYDGIEGYIFLVKNINNETDSLYNVTLIQKPDSDKNRKEAVIKADRGYLESSADGQLLTLYLFDGSTLRNLTRTSSYDPVTEETHFDRYRISFDLSDLSFSRSNPDQRTRNDRTMSAEAMLAVVDSLRIERESHIEESFNQDNSFTPPADTTEITRQTYQLQVSSNRTGVADTVDKVKSEYLAVNLMKNRKNQLGLAEMAISDLRKYKSNVENLKTNVSWRDSRISRYLVEVHKKFSIPFACLIFVLIGAPIGMFTKKGNIGYAALFGTGFLTFYWISLIQGEKMADRLFITPFWAMWFSNIILGIIGTYLVVRLCTSFKISNLWKKSDS
ncbi:LptF/LptG family permease [Aliifodinibius sp. S!AR15-10]|uniref:LptF/LptG family permease n=1 Tax=Aliifodinibius sp. S!AR15-10 TaxID=2950437 RepID=UPI002864C5F6|nr:LptF/LptG family permease [Aliifodinibius sp. S!AR15-10]MDR8390274.1 LptF/LptG family permease [Aliifodinibius sp. S!AR15-10]